MKTTFLTFSLLLVFLRVDGQTPAWTSMGLGFNGTGNTLFVWNGTLYGGGGFTMAGNANAMHAAKWTGSQWQAMGAGFDATVTCFATYNNELYAGGYFNISGTSLRKHIAKWNGTSWEDVGGGISGFCINDMIEYNGKLYVTGKFTQAGSVAASHIAVWDGTTWSTVGNYGINSSNPYCAGWCLEEYDNKLFVGGIIDSVDATPVGHIATWDGANWGTADMGMNDPVSALESYNGLLYVGGYFTATWYGNLAQRLATWDGNSWSPCGSGFNSVVETIYGYGDLLYIGGWFTGNANIPSSCMVTWDGSLYGTIGEPSNVVYSICADEGIVYATGEFTTMASTNANRVAKYAAPGVGIDESSDSVISVFPNPSNGIIEFGIDACTGTTIEIFSLQGTLVRRLEFDTVNPRIDLSAESKSVYFFYLFDGEEQVGSGRFVLE